MSEYSNTEYFSHQTYWCDKLNDAMAPEQVFGERSVRSRNPVVPQGHLFEGFKQNTKPADYLKEREYFRKSALKQNIARNPMNCVSRSTPENEDAIHKILRNILDFLRNKFRKSYQNDARSEVG